MDFEPYFKSATKSRSVHHFRELSFSGELQAGVTGCLMNSNLFYFWFTTVGNCRNLTNDDILDFPIGDPSSGCASSLNEEFSKLMADYRANSDITVRYNCEYQTFYPSRSKNIIDRIDNILAEHFSFTDEELDFIINYDIKYRMGLSGGSTEDDDG